MSKIIAIANQKGGVGKTTTAINLSAALAKLDYRCLVIDMDPQGNCSRGLGIEINTLSKTIFDVLIAKDDVNEVKRKTNFNNLDVLPSNLNLANFNVIINNISNKPHYALKEVVSKLNESYDYIIIDCPPSLGLLTINALSASNSVLIPVQCEYFALEALAQMLGTISEIKHLYNNDLEIEGFVLTMYQTHTNLSKEIAQEVRSMFKENTFISVIPRNISIPEANAQLMPVTIYRPSSAGSLSYSSLAKELLDYEKRKTKAIE